MNPNVGHFTCAAVDIDTCFKMPLESSVGACMGMAVGVSGGRFGKRALTFTLGMADDDDVKKERRAFDGVPIGDVFRTNACRNVQAEKNDDLDDIDSILLFLAFF